MREGILFLTPCYGGNCTEPFFHSALRTIRELTMLGVEYDWLTERNESLVHRGRMEMLASFLETDYSHLFWIDADIDFKPEDVAALWNLQTDIACGVYRMKKAGEKLFSAWVGGKLVNLDDCPKEPFPVDYCGTGFLLISRKAVEKLLEERKRLHEAAKLFAEAIVEAFPGMDEEKHRFLQGMADHYAHDWEGKGRRRVPALFMTPIHNDGLESEDYNFCRIAREAGMQIIMDPKIKLGHWGQFRFG